MGIKKLQFWDLKINSHTGWREYTVGFTEKNNNAKKRSKLRTIEKQRLKNLENGVSQIFKIRNNGLLCQNY